ncbi:MAG: hypothetical protein KDA52_11945 [Planctomycetaceae bacterium]|nr:hypothetical protein [Planctomycetaceae bacterium]
MELFEIILILTCFGVIGYVIGDTKAVGKNGFWLCFLFGPLGLYAIIIIVTLKPDVPGHEYLWRHVELAWRSALGPPIDSKSSSGSRRRAYSG